MFSNIVVGTDGSPTAGEAVRQAIEVARTAAATLHVVTAYRSALSLLALPPDSGLAAAPIAEVEEDLEKLSVRVAGEAAELARRAGVRTEVYAVPGDAAEAIVDVAETAKADLVFVGNKGHSSRKRYLLGSVAGRVSHHAPCHVMIVHTTG